MITLCSFFPNSWNPKQRKGILMQFGFSRFRQDIVKPSINCLQKRGVTHLLSAFFGAA